MNDNPIRVGETPIFDQLARELGYERLVTCGPANQQREPKVALRFLGFVPLEEPRIVGEVTPVQFMEEENAPQQHITELVKQFREKYPDVVPEIKTKSEIDGTLSVSITPSKEKPVEWPIPATWMSEDAISYKSGSEDFNREQVEYFSDSIADANLVLRKINSEIDSRTIRTPEDLVGYPPEIYRATAAFVSSVEPEQTDESSTTKSAPEGEIFPIPGVSFLPPYFKTEPKTHHVPEDLTGRQSELHKALTAPVIPVDPITTEQTDESVNAAPKDDWKSLGRTMEGFTTKPVPRPLWISDEEITLEE
jgi:hypothetical protein